jgi:DNA adenine methylase
MVLHGSVQQAALPLDEPAEGARPFVKWAGGKRQLLPELLRRRPPVFGRYFEPFVGGGALFFELRPREATLADVNVRLVRTYQGIRDDVEGVIRLLSGFPHDEAFFYEMRERDIDARSDAEVAAWFVYLNKTCYNGLYRVNKGNVFNVPFGRYDNPAICNPPLLRACSAALRGVDLRVEDFASAAQRAQAGDFVYFDPPYVPLSATSSFTSYTSTGFGDEAQVRLRDVALDLKRRGVHVVLSNSAAPFVRQLYRKGFEVCDVAATRMVNSKASGRGAITELVIR